MRRRQGPRLERRGEPTTTVWAGNAVACRARAILRLVLVMEFIVSLGSSSCQSWTARGATLRSNST